MRALFLGDAWSGAAMTGHTVVIAGGGPTGLMLAGELALASVDVVVVERRTSQDLDGSRAGGLQDDTGVNVELADEKALRGTTSSAATEDAA